jgi:hypothetical protein
MMDAFRHCYCFIGDLGQTGWTKSTLEHIENSNYNVLLFAGDLSYADYYQPLWDSFGKLVTPYASAKPWMVTQGNHDIEGIPYIVDPFRAYNTRWQMPYSESGSDSNQFYSFETAGVHVLMLASYADFDEDSSQYKWLQVRTPSLSLSLSLSPGLFLCVQKFVQFHGYLLAQPPCCLDFGGRSNLVFFGIFLCIFLL